ncbi:MAG TPA: DUF29 domain-containing protein [Geminicoccaceae bacterium]
MSKLQPSELYERDFFAWTQFQARELQRFARTRPNLPLDLEHIAEEVRDLGKEQRNALRSWVRRIIEHLLLLDHSPAEEPRRGWQDEILNLRSEIELRLSATLRRDLERHLPVLYLRARRHLVQKLEAHGEREAARPLPETCPYTLDQILGDIEPFDG